MGTIYLLCQTIWISNLFCLWHFGDKLSLLCQNLSLRLSLRLSLWSQTLYKHYRSSSFIWKWLSKLYFLSYKLFVQDIFFMPITSDQIICLTPQIVGTTYLFYVKNNRSGFVSSHELWCIVISVLANNIDQVISPVSQLVLTCHLFNMYGIHYRSGYLILCHKLFEPVVSFIPDSVISQVFHIVWTGCSIRVWKWTMNVLKHIYFKYCGSHANLPWWTH